MTAALIFCMRALLCPPASAGYVPIGNRQIDGDDRTSRPPGPRAQIRCDRAPRADFPRHCRCRRVHPHPTGHLAGRKPDTGTLYARTGSDGGDWTRAAPRRLLHGAHSRLCHILVCGARAVPPDLVLPPFLGRHPLHASDFPFAVARTRSRRLVLPRHPTFVVTARAECEAHRISEASARDMILTAEFKNKKTGNENEAVREVFPRMAGAERGIAQD